MTGQSGRPRAGQSVEIHDADGKSSLGRAQSVSGESVVVAIGTPSAVALTAHAGATFDIVWPGAGGVTVLPARLLQRQGASQLELWEFAPVGEARSEQRRRQARIGVAGPVTLTMFSDAAARGLPGPAMHSPLAGTLIDVSEAALQCLIAVEADDPVVTAGAAVMCEFAPDGSHFSLRGVVHAAWTVGAPPRVRVVVQFDEDQPEMVALAAFVTAAERDTDEP